jgi:hypothetical protein
MTYDSTKMEAARTRTFGEALIRSGAVMVGCLAVCACAGPGGVADAEAQANLRDALTFHASFDGTVDAEFALGDRRLHTAASYEALEDGVPGLNHPDVTLASGAGRYGDALSFVATNKKAIYYLAEQNIAYQPVDWNGTIAFWLSLDPEADLETFSDPVQMTDEAYDDGALWVDFTMGGTKQFRFGVFGDKSVWNPENLSPSTNLAFVERLVIATDTPFSRSTWTHVVMTYAGLGGEDGHAALYLDGVLQGGTPTIAEPFTLDAMRATIRLGVSYVGLLDDLAVFNRELDDEEIAVLHQLDGGVGTLHR